MSIETILKNKDTDSALYEAYLMVRKTLRNNNLSVLEKRLDDKELVCSVIESVFQDPKRYSFDLDWVYSLYNTKTIGNDQKEI